jgi:hypothetical protein
MDLNWQPAPLGGEAADDAIEGPPTAIPPMATTVPAATPPPITAAEPVATGLGGFRRILATVGLAIGLLTVGGVSVVMAASPSPSASTAPSASGSTGTTSPGTKHNCPNMGTSGSGYGSSGSASPSTGAGS